MKNLIRFRRDAIYCVSTLFLFSCHGFDGMFTDKESNAFKAGASVRLPKAGGGKVLGTMFDVDGDGKSDGLDLNGDNVPEILFKNLVIGEWTGLDANGDGLIDYYLSVDYQGNFYINTARPSGNSTSGNVTITTDNDNTPTGFNSSGGSSVDNGILGQIYADATPPTAGTNNAGGSYTTIQSVTLTCTDNVACNSVSYTTNGSQPDFAGNGIVASGNSLQLTLAGSVTLKWLTRDANGNTSAIQSAVFTIDTAGPTAPGSFTAARFDDNRIDLSWSASSDDQTAQGSIVYEICRTTTAGGCTAFTATYTTGAGATNFNATSLTALTTYFFTIRAKDSLANAGNPSAEVMRSTAVIGYEQWTAAIGQAKTDALIAGVGLSLLDNVATPVGLGNMTVFLNALTSMTKMNDWIKQTSNTTNVSGLLVSAADLRNNVSLNALAGKGHGERTCENEGNCNTECFFHGY